MVEMVVMLPLIFCHDPLGQTFISEGVNGAFVTSIDLFFQTRGTRPVYVQLVNAVDGHPSLKIIAQKNYRRKGNKCIG